MSLVIDVYRKLKVVENPQLTEDGEPFNFESEWKPGENMEWSEEFFKGRGKGLESQNVYSFEEEYTFSAGGKWGDTNTMMYSHWRTRLENFATGNDFAELIDFSDCQGVIGPVVTKKLAKDFRDNESKAKGFAKTIDNGEYWLTQYQLWKKAFEFASDDGALNFSAYY